MAKYYISVNKWIPAINRFKKLVKEYDKTIFIEEALHQFSGNTLLFRTGRRGKKICSTLLGYNYNSSEWFENLIKF